MDGEDAEDHPRDDPRTYREPLGCTFVDACPASGRTRADGAGVDHRGMA